MRKIEKDITYIRSPEERESVYREKFIEEIKNNYERS